MRALANIIRILEQGGVPCLFHEFTGLYCPGCGGTRAAKALLSGHPFISLLYHPLVIYCVAVAVIFAVSYLIYWRSGDGKYKLCLSTGYVYGGVAVTAVNFLVKNYYLIARGVDLLERLPKV